MKKYLLSLLLPLLMAVTASASDFSAVNGDGVEIYYSINGDGYTVSVAPHNYNYAAFEDIKIPAKVTNPATEIEYTVTGLLDGAFVYCHGLHFVTFPATMDYFGPEAFKYCTSLEGIYGPLASADNRCLILNGQLVAFARYGLTEYSIPEGVTYIRDDVFKDCSALTALTFPSSLTAIGRNVFLGCSGLSAIYGENASADHRCLIVDNEVLVFARDGLTEYTVPDGVTEIGYSAFYGCSDLTKVTLPSTIKSIGYFGFRECTSLTDINLESTALYKTFQGAFRGCTSLATVTFPETYSIMSIETFLDCASLATVNLPSSLTELGGESFKNTALYKDDANWDNYVLYIGNYLIRAKGALEGSYTVKDGTLLMGDAAFSECYDLTNVTLPNTLKKISISAFYKCTNLLSVDIPESVTEIDINAFGTCTSLAHVTIPETVTVIGQSAFENCESLVKVTLPQQLAKIGASAFAGCTALQEICIPDKVTEIGQYAFDNCSGMRSVIIGGCYPKFGLKPFDGCTSLIKCAYNSYLDNPFDPSVLCVVYPRYDRLVEDGCVYNADKSQLYFVSPVKEGEYALPAEVKNIGENAFKYCSLLTDIAPQGLEAPEYEANNFESLYESVNLRLKADAMYSYLCTGDWSLFKNIYAGSALLQDYEDAQYAYRINAETAEAILTGVKDPSMAAVVIPDTVECLGTVCYVTVLCGSAFKDMAAMESLQLPAKLVTIFDYAFSGCTGLSSLTLPESLVSIGNRAFSGCTALKTVTIPWGVEHIGEAAFSFCTNLEYFYGQYASADNKFLVVDGKLICFAISPAFNYPTYQIPNTVTSIGVDAFGGCAAIDAVTIPCTVATIGDRAFNCPTLGTVRIESGMAPELGADVFANELSYFVLQVPMGQSWSYKSNDLWRNSFTEITEIEVLFALTDAEGYTSKDEVWCTSATYTRNFSHTNWHGLCLPFDMDFWDWASYGQMAELTGVTDGVLEWTTMMRGGKTEAGKPYIFMPYEVGEITFTVNYPTVKTCEYLPTVEFPGYRLQGTYVEKTDMAATNAYALHNGMFYYSTNPAKTLKPFRIFLTLHKVINAPVQMTVDGQNVAGIDGLEIDGQTDGSPAYNLQGQPVGDNYKGILIINGQKVMRQ